MKTKKEMTAPIASVGADAEQSSQKCTKDSITDIYEKINKNFLIGGDMNG